MRTIGIAPLQQTAALPTCSYQISARPTRTIGRRSRRSCTMDGFLCKGTGQNGRSSIRKVKLDTGEVVQKRDLPAELALWRGSITDVWQRDLIQLTWRSHVAFVYDRTTFEPTEAVSYRRRRLGPDSQRHRAVDGAKPGTH